MSKENQKKSGRMEIEKAWICLNMQDRKIWIGEAPLASRLRPTTLEEVVGQQHIIGKDKLLYRAIKADKLSSIIFYGPPEPVRRHWRK